MTMNSKLFRYKKEYFPYIAPWLLPITNTLMTCSVYATVTVALNRYMEMSDMETGVYGNIRENNGNLPLNGNTQQQGMHCGKNKQTLQGLKRASSSN